jgi:hypothetical protein
MADATSAKTLALLTYCGGKELLVRIHQPDADGNRLFGTFFGWVGWHLPAEKALQVRMTGSRLTDADIVWEGECPIDPNDDYDAALEWVTSQANLPMAMPIVALAA